jgi:23S rRNA (guanosine2251-2'-O)-methyltransferase
MKPRSTGGGRGPSRGAPRGTKKHRGGKPAPREHDGPRAPRPDKHSLGGSQVEGRQAVRELLIARKRKAYEILISNDLDKNDIIDDIIELANDQRVPVRYVPRNDIEREARSEAPQGIIATAAGIPEVEIGDILKNASPTRKPFFVAIDGVTDPGNLGAILRSCDGAGVDAVVLPRHRAVHITPTAAKSAAGAAEYVPMCIVGGLPDAADKNIFEMGSLASESVCLVLGAEGPGLSRLVRERCDLLVSIPMLGALSSLNVSAAAALATYEVVRARTTK